MLREEAQRLGKQQAELQGNRLVVDMYHLGMMCPYLSVSGERTRCATIIDEYERRLRRLLSLEQALQDEANRVQTTVRITYFNPRCTAVSLSA
jgi:hypothetical protein